MTDPLFQKPSVIIHCDWGKDASKRWMAVATRKGDIWHLAASEPVGSSVNLFDRVHRRAEEQGPILAGFDFPIGLPAAYGELTGLEDFPTAIRSFGAEIWADWFNVCQSRDEISVRRPFYPMRPGGTKREHLLKGLGLPASAIMRRCELKTEERQQACSLFWTLGGNQVGKGAITGWRELIQPSIERVGLWPFGGPLVELLGRFPTVIVETYPADAFGQIGLNKNAGWSKRNQESRKSVAQAIVRWLNKRPVEPSHQLLREINDGFSEYAAGEDQFDAVVGLFGMLDTLWSGRADSYPSDANIQKWEGWIFGQDVPE